jgi:hypothetical protein
VEAVLGGLAAGSAVTRARQARLSKKPSERGAIEDDPVRRVATKDLLRVVGRRGFRRLRRTFADENA